MKPFNDSKYQLVDEKMPKNILVEKRDEHPKLNMRMKKKL
jgi:hypothetical protein